jgi:hypothetical protein
MSRRARNQRNKREEAFALHKTGAPERRKEDERDFTTHERLRIDPRSPWVVPLRSRNP